MLRAGDLVQIGAEAWKAYLKAEGFREDRPSPGVRTVVRITKEGFLLDYPLHFWSESDLEAPPSHRVMKGHP